MLSNNSLEELSQPAFNGTFEGLDYGPLNPVNPTHDTIEYDHSMPLIVKFAWSTVFLFMVITAACGNCIVIWIVVAHRRMRTVTNYFLVNLSTADLLLTTFNCIFNFIYMLQRLRIAYFHSISLALNAKQPKIFEDIVAPIKKTLMEKFWQEKDLQEFISGLMKNGYESVGDDLELKEYLERLEPKIIEFFITELLKDDHKLVVAQSDCWCNNFLFKYQAQNDSKPSKVCILDWQIVHVNSPVYDLAYFFLLAASKDDLNQYEKYMDNYYEVLRNRLISFGCDPDEVFSYSTFKKHYEAPRILDALGDGVGFADKLNFVMKDRSECDQRVKDVVQFMKERNMGFLE